MALQPSGVSILSPRMERASRISPAEAGQPDMPRSKQRQQWESERWETKWAQAGGDTGI